MGVLDTPINAGHIELMPKGHCYLLSYKKRGVLYCGVTTNLAARVFAHQQSTASQFTAKYKITRLVWYETYDLVTDAIQRETNIKHWKRDWKLKLIEDFDPDWNDLYDGLG